MKPYDACSLTYIRIMHVFSLRSEVCCFFPFSPCAHFLFAFTVSSYHIHFFRPNHKFTFKYIFLLKTYIQMRPFHVSTTSKGHTGAYMNIFLFPLTQCLGNILSFLFFLLCNIFYAVPLPCSVFYYCPQV